MDNKKPQVGTSSSLTSQLFGPQGSSSSDVLASIFPPSKARAPWENDPTGNKPWNAKQDNAYKYGESNSASEERSSIYQQKGAEPSNLSSSLYYGGRELYSKSSNNANQTITSYPIVNKDGGEDDPTAASRGNWWQGSLYY